MVDALKFHKLISFGVALGFLIVVQKFATPEPIFRFLVPGFLILSALVTLYNVWYLKKTNKYNFWHLIRPLLLLLSAFGLFTVFPGEQIRGLFLLTAVFFITFSEVLIGTTAENLVLAETLLIAFGQFFALTAYYEYAPNYSIYFTFAIFISTTILSRAFFENIPYSKNVKLACSVIMGLFTAEIFWSLTFLPQHFSATAFLLFSIFYFCLVTNYYYFFHNLNYKKVQFHLFLIIACCAWVLITTPWSIIQ